MAGPLYNYIQTAGLQLYFPDSLDMIKTLNHSHVWQMTWNFSESGHQENNISIGSDFCTVLAEIWQR